MSDVVLSRRAVLGGIAVTAFAGLGRVAFAGPLEDVLATPAVDLHSHAGGFIRPNDAKYDIARRMIQGKFGIVTLAAVADWPVLQKQKAIRQPSAGELFAHTARQLDAIDAMIKGYNLVRILKPEDVQTAYGSGKAGLIVAVEGADFLEGKIERVEWAFQRGLRHLQLVHYRVNELGDIMTQDPVHGGLTAFGAEVVRECNRLGIIIDVAHASAAVNFKVVELSRAPVVVSHGAITRQAPRAGSRLITADQAKAIIDKGGIIGLWPAGAMFRNIDVWAGGLANMVKTWGADAVAIGTDMEGGIEEVFNDYATYPKVVEAVLAKDIAPADVAKIVGGNHMRVFKAVSAAASA